MLRRDEGLLELIEIRHATTQGTCHSSIVTAFHCYIKMGNSKRNENKEASVLWLHGLSELPLTIFVTIVWY